MTPISWFLLTLVFMSWSSASRASGLVIEKHSGNRIELHNEESPRLMRLKRDDACKILKEQVGASKLSKILNLKKQYGWRIVAKPSRFAGKWDVVFLVGEAHVHTCNEAVEFQSVLRDFNHIAIEAYGEAEGESRGLPVSSTYLKHALSTYEGLKKVNTKKDFPIPICHSSTLDAYHFAAKYPGKRLFLLDGNDPDKALSLGDQLRYLDRKGNENHGRSINKKLDQFKNVSFEERLILAEELNQEEEIARKGKIIPLNWRGDTRSKIMAQNIGLSFGRSKITPSPLLSITGALHVAYIKHQLMLYQGFQEITPQTARECLPKIIKQNQ